MDKYYKNFEQIRQHYEIEKEIANKLRNSSRQERQSLYSSLYDELFQRVPYHPQLAKKSSAQDSMREVSYQMRNLHPFLKRDVVFLEIGAGDCALSFEVAKFVKQVYAVDVSKKIAENSTFPQNVQFIEIDGLNIPTFGERIDIVYSYQLMEHLHPDDAQEQLQNIYKALSPGGMYICDTPNRLSGPHDISKFFDVVSRGLHLKEYTIEELSSLFRKVGFSKIMVYIRVKKIYIFAPVLPVLLCERLLDMLPYSCKKAVASNFPCKLLLGIRLVGTK
jgi:SAM-dependent methyltransferase